MECYYCGWSNDQHDEHCPEPIADPEAKEAAKAIWEQGRRDGRAGREQAQSDNPTYRLGWVEGDVAADYAQNVSYYDYYPDAI